MILPDDSHGRIACGTVMVPDFAAACADYATGLGLVQVESGPVSPAHAQSWGAPALTGRPMAVFQPTSGAASSVRLIAGTAVPDFEPNCSYGWTSLEISVRDVWQLHAQLVTHGAFRIVGAPKLVDGFTSFIPMQVVGRSGETLYLNQVLQSMSDLDLPAAHANVDAIFITVLAAPDRAAALDFYINNIGFEAGATYSFAYSPINNAFGLAADTQSTISMTKVGRLPGVEIDQYPAQTRTRPIATGELPPGVGMVSYMVQSLDRIKAEFISAPAPLAGCIYGGRRAATVRGAAGEFLELIECSA